MNPKTRARKGVASLQCNMNGCGHTKTETENDISEIGLGATPSPNPHPRYENASANQKMFMPDVTKCTRGPPQARKIREKCLSTEWRRIKLYMTNDTRPAEEI